MIERVSVKGIGGIGRAELDFEGDFIVITGESGAGKSSLVRAFELISGGRAQTSAINASVDEAEVAALWSTPDGEMLARRTISRSGKGRVTIDGELASVSSLARAASPLTEIQSQFAQLDLLDQSRQLELVDGCGGEELALAAGELKRIFPEMIALEREAVELKKRRAALEAELEGATERVRRIRSLKITETSEAEWAAELESIERSLKEAGRHEEIARQISGGDGPDLVEQLTSTLRAIYAAAPDDARDRWTSLGEGALTDIQTLFAEASRTLSLVPREELEEARDAIEAKLGAVRKLRRETGAADARGLAEYADRAEQGMKWLEGSAESIARVNAEAAAKKASAASIARRLRALREEAASSFSARVREHLRDLAMDGATFSADVERLDRVRANGAETVVFTLAIGGSAPLPIAKAASGGELSRILIAIQSSIDSSRLPGSIIFDEVEAGLGGRTALLAGQKLRELAGRCRVILITHEATIAAMADQHFLVHRVGDETRVEEITGAARESEIARMLSGASTSEALDHARSLLRARR